MIFCVIKSGFHLSCFQQEAYYYFKEKRLNSKNKSKAVVYRPLICFAFLCEFSTEAFIFAGKNTELKKTVASLFTICDSPFLFF